MTWGDVKLITLQKVFAIADGRMKNDDTTREYLTAMPGAANEGLQRLFTVGRFLKRKMEITQGQGVPGVEANIGGVCRYDLVELAPDFYTMGDDGIYFAGGDAYYKATNWTMEAGRVLVLPANAVGTWTIWYNAYPGEMTATTADTHELPLHPEMAVLLPLYIASQVYKDDDISLATQYRNEFEVGMEGLMAASRQSSAGGGTWRSTTGWW